MKLIAIANQKGGVGKTTTAVTLATCLSEKGKNVLLVDLDPQGNATSAVGIDEAAGKSLYEALIGQADAKDKIIATRFNNLAMIPADLDLAGAEVEVARLDDHLTRLRDVLISLGGDTAFDYIFLDCPRTRPDRPPVLERAPTASCPRLSLPLAPRVGSLSP